jgi:hypothetical protein
MLYKNIRSVGFILITALGGCASAPGVQLSAADSMELLAASLATTIDEYRVDLDQLDQQRRKAVVDAFVVRVRTDHDIPYALENHTAAFTDALNRLEADRQAASDRRQAALENIEAIQEIAAGLRQVAIESMNLDDEARRYLAGVLSKIPDKNKSGETNALDK